MSRKTETRKISLFKQMPIRITGAVLAGFILLALALPVITGLIIDNRLGTFRTALEEQGLPIAAMRFDRGWFASALEVDLEAPALFTPPQSGKNAQTWTVNLTVHHGPFLQWSGSPALGLARLAGVLLLPPGGFADGRAPVELQIHIFADFGNKQQGTLIVPSRFEEMETVDQNITIDWAGLRTDTYLSAGETGQESLQIPGIEVHIMDKADEDFLLVGAEDVRLDTGADFVPADDEEGPLTPDARFEAGEIYYDLMVLGNRRALSLNNLLLIAENTPDGARDGLFHQRGRTRLDTFHLIHGATRVPASDLVLRHRIENLDRETLARLSELFSLSGLLPGLATEVQTESHSPDLLARLINNGTALRILSLAGETPVGGFTAWMDLAVNERAAAQDTAGLPALLNALAGEGEVVLEERLARALAEFSLRRQLGEVTDTLSPEALDTLSDALLAEQAGTYGLRRGDGRYELTFEVTGGYLFVGGQPVYALAGLLN